MILTFPQSIANFATFESANRNVYFVGVKMVANFKVSCLLVGLPIFVLSFYYN